MDIKLLRVKESVGKKILSPGTVAELMKEEAKADREIFWVLHLNTRMKVIEKEMVAMGTLNQTTVHPREVFKKAIVNSADSIITVHNHPSGSTRPSQEDKTMWQKLKKAGEIIGIKVRDNIIVTPSGDYYSEDDERIKMLRA